MALGSPLVLEPDLVADLLAEEDERLARIAAGVEHQCSNCGCSESLPCPGGCVWATPNLCSRCEQSFY